jgi:NhaP-type Na+/H+ or K+/H+ antiporter
VDRTDASLAALTLAGAAAAGIVSQSIARTLSIPGIVVLLAAGTILGPDVAGLIQPHLLGSALFEVVAFSVAIILFEGGMHLDLARFPARGTAIRRLVTYGAVLTAVGGALTARVLLGWEWREAGLFGCLVIVTGPTVVTPLVRRFQVAPAVATILEAEGVLIDAIGAVIAVVALDVALEPNGQSLARAVVGVAARLGFGALVGLAGGFLLAYALQHRNVVSDGLENVFTLALVWTMFKASDALVHESGIAAVIVAGLVVGNARLRLRRRLLDFKNQLTVLLIGILFVLLAADVRLADVAALGVRGVLVVAALVLVVRPLAIGLLTIGTSLSWRQRAFIAWLGPRGIIAAAVASLFAAKLTEQGLAGGQQLKAMVFLVIAVTVVLAGLTGGLAASLLGVRQAQRGWLFLGANDLACTVARRLMAAGVEVACIDTSVDHCARARAMGIDVVHGDGLDDATLDHAQVALRAGIVALTSSDEVNLLFVENAASVGRIATRFVALRSATLGVTTAMVHRSGGFVLFGDDYDIESWSAWLKEGEAEVVPLAASPDARLGHDVVGATLAVPLVHRRGDIVRPVADDLVLRRGDIVEFAVRSDRSHEAFAQLAAQGWHPAGDVES